MAGSDPRINVVMPADLYERFQRHLFETGRRKKGAISEAICEAVEEWMASDEGEGEQDKESGDLPGSVVD